MKIFHNSQMVNEFTEIILGNQIEQSKDRTGIHRSDVIACPLKCIWRIMGYEALFDSSDIGIFIIGSLAHVALHANFDAQEREYPFDDLPQEDLDFLKQVFPKNSMPVITVDGIKGEFPIESKTTRKKIFKREEIPNDWIEQLCFAMARMGAKRGFLMIINIISFVVMVWEFELSDDEMKMFNTAFKAKVRLLIQAIKTKDITILEPKFSECKYCPYKPNRIKRKGKWAGCPKYKPEEKD